MIVADVPAQRLSGDVGRPFGELGREDARDLPGFDRAVATRGFTREERTTAGGREDSAAELCKRRSAREGFVAHRATIGREPVRRPRIV